MYKICASMAAEDTSLVEVTTHELGDPRKNKFVGSGGQGVTHEQYFRFAMQMFSTENIRNNPDIFNAHRNPNYNSSEFVQKFLSKVPEALHPYSFCFALSYNTWESMTSDVRYSLTYDTYSMTVYGTNYGCQQVLLTSDTYWASLILYLQTIKEFFEGSVWRTIKNTKTNYNTIAGENAFRYAAWCMSGNRYIQRGTATNTIGQGGTITAESALDILSEENTDVRFYYDAQYGYILICPVSIRNKSTLYQLFSASQDVTAVLGKGSPVKKKLVKNGKSIEVSKAIPRYYGVELELSTDKTVKEMINYQGDPVFFLSKSDASITGSKRGRFECVTIPMEISDHRKCWTRFFANVGDKNDFDVTTQTNNGMHVHISKNCFTDNHLTNFTWFITAPENREFILQLAQRTQESFDRWSPCPKYNNRSSHYKAFKDCVAQVGSLRGAVNTGQNRGKGTVEVRIFKGIVSCAEVLRNLEVVDSIFEFTKPVKEGGPSTYFTLTVQDYYNWVKATPRNQYKLLRADLWKLDIPNLVKKARVIRLLFNTTDPEAIVKKVNDEKTRTESLKDDQKRLVIDKVVFAAVTRLIGRRAFGINDDGQLVIAHRAVGRIAHLDEKLIRNYDKQTKAAQ